ncbi:hypothetical protein BT93_C1098 [Corymbia citriodora subsp. variegata]|nr:hypothetical protein BT93_C1098 [Corymbia citriodora subsp. variegata]
MASPSAPYVLVALLVVLSGLAVPSSAAPSPRMLSLVKTQPLVLKYHKGQLLKGNVTVNLLWYGRFSRAQLSVVADFFRSLGSPAGRSPSVASWWSTTAAYAGGPANIVFGRQLVDSKYSLGKSLKNQDIVSLASKLAGAKSSGEHAVNFVLTSSDVGVEGFCMSRCGSHGWSTTAPGGKGAKFAYAWVGNPVKQCPASARGPSTSRSTGLRYLPGGPNGDVGADGMIISLATVLAGTVTNPFDKGYFQGPDDAPLEAVSACTGIFGKGAFPGYPGSSWWTRRRERATTRSAWGTEVSAAGDVGPKTSTCKTAV